MSSNATESPFGLITQADLEADFSGSIIAANIAVAALAVVAVALRVVARRYMKLPLLWDDWMIFIALPFAVALATMTCISAKHGLGKHVYAIAPNDVPIEAKTFISTELLWASSLPFIKCSLLFFYVRIFGTLKYFRTIGWWLGGFNFVYAAQVILVCAFQCIPLAAVWDMTITDKHCIDSGLYFIIGSVPDFVTDIITLILPVPAIWGLHTSLAQRIMLLGVFALGSFTCVCSLVRFAMLCIYGRNPDVTWALGNLGIWSTVEVCIAIVAACLPTHWPLITAVFPGLRRRGTATPARPEGYTSGGRSRKKFLRKDPEASYGLSDAATYNELTDRYHDPMTKTTVVNEVTATREPGWEMEIPREGIRVQTTHSVV